jgi:hypothetical protein
MNWATIRPLIIIAVAVWGLFSFLGTVTKSSGDYSVAEAACEPPRLISLPMFHGRCGSG